VALIGNLSNEVSHAALEKVHSMPGQGVASTFKFGKGFGVLTASLIAFGVDFMEVSPQKWQKYWGCMTKGNKNVSKARAQELFPDIKVTHKIADALLLAAYAIMNNEGEDPWQMI
jgi:hypothetical protein